MSSKRKPLFQLGMAEMIGVLSVFSIVFGAMWAPAIAFPMVVLVVVILAAAIVSIAWVGVGEARTFALGNVAWTVVYLLACIAIECDLGLFKKEPERFVLPTTYLWEQLREPLTQFELRPLNESASYPDAHVSDDGRSVLDENGVEIGYVADWSGRKVSGIGFYIKETPSATRFLRTGYLLWYLALGYLGGKFAVAFARFQNRQEEIPVQNG